MGKQDYHIYRIGMNFFNNALDNLSKHRDY